MVNTKRIIIATIFGVLAGIICYVGAISLGLKIDPLRAIFIIINRTLIGFVIGISAIRIKWALHGILIGEIVGLPFFLYDLMIGVDLGIVIAVVVMSGLFGLMIEFLTSIVFNAPIESV